MMASSKKWTEIKVGFIPLPFYLILVLIATWAYKCGALKSNMYTGFLLCSLYGCFARFIVDNVPIIKKTLGGAFIAIFCASLVYYGLVPKKVVTICNDFIQGKIDFLACFIITLICGTVLSMDRKLLIKVGSRYFIPIIGGLIFAYGIASVVGEFMGISWKHTVLYIAGPIMGGGNGAGAVPMSEIYSGITGEKQGDIYSQLHVFTTLGNWLSIFAAIFLNYLGRKKPYLTGNGAMMPGASVEESKVSYDEFTFEFKDLLIGICFAAGIFLFGRICSKFISAIHAYAFVILTVAFCKIFGLVPKKMEFCSLKLYEFIGKSMMVSFTGGLGIAMFNLSTLFKSLTPTNLIICIATVIGGMIGSGIFGKLVSFYPIESMITAGLCMSNSGGNGDIYILTSADRMELMPFAQISSRLGGALVLVIQSILANMLLKAL